VIGGERRHAAPVVDARVQQPELHPGLGEVRGSLQVHPGAEHDPRYRDRRQELLVAGLGAIAHRGARLGAEVLNDHLLHVAVAAVELPDR